MAGITVVGGGIGGLTSAMLLARDGHDVTVLERDPSPPPESADAAWADWERRGVSQFRMLHYILPRFRMVIEVELPAVADALVDAGALRLSPLEGAPEGITGGERDGDDRFVSLTARRPVLERVLAQAAAATPGLTVRRGVAVAGLVADTATPPGVPHVIGVRTDSGDELLGDLVVDAAGRRSALPRWLPEIGAAAPVEELEDCGFVYYGRHFRSGDGSVPSNMGPLLQHYGTVSVLTLPADNGTWGCGIVTSARDTPMRALRHTDRWAAMWRSFPLVAHWIDGEPISDGVAIMAKIEDRHRDFAPRGEPVATGVVAVADSWACTNPSVGRGASIGLLHAVALRDVLRDLSLDDRLGVAKAWDETTRAVVEPWYRATLEFDRHRLAEIESLVEGNPYEPDDPTWEITRALMHGAMSDPDALRAFLSVTSLVASADEVLAEPGVFEKVVAAGSGWRDAEIPAPDRAGLLDLVGA